MASYARLAVLILAATALCGSPIRAQPAEDEQGATLQPSPVAGEGQIHPLASKEEMVRDRFQRFEDRVYRLRELLDQQEPENAARLARVLERAGELGLADRLSTMIGMLRDPALLNEAADAQTQWVVDADRLLAVLLDEDSENEQRRGEMERLQDYHRKIGELLDQEQTLRDAAGREAAQGRMKAQLDQAIKRVEALQGQQGQLSDKTEQQRGTDGDGAKQLSTPQEDLAREAKRLAEDLRRLSELGAEEATEESSEDAARSETQAASESVEKSAGAMSQAGKSLERSDAGSAQEQQEKATEALREAQEQLERAREGLDEQENTEKLGEQQQDLADQAKSLSDQMRQDAQSGGSQGQQQGGQQQSPSPGQQNVDQAQREMDDASESLDESQPQEALPKQDRAIDQLQQAQEELEKALDQLRKEEREEILRDLEGRFREMLFKQRAINEATVRLDQKGAEGFGRAERLELADLSVDERSLSQDAATCLHILDEDGTTVVFPRVVGQISEDMGTVADRLAAIRVGVLTQTIEEEIVQTLEELLQAVQRMRQEAEQQPGGQNSGSADDLQPLLPTSAELKLLKAGQVRVNDRTVAIETARGDTSESGDDLDDAVRAVSARQVECGEMAKEIRDRQGRP